MGVATDYSFRSADIGSTVIARRAGRMQARETEDGGVCPDAETKGQHGASVAITMRIQSTTIGSSLSLIGHPKKTGRFGAVGQS